MTRIELEGVLTEELVENPVLEEGEAVAEEEAPDEEKADETEGMSDVDLEAYFGDYAESWEGKGHSSVYEERQGPPLENMLSRDPDLYDNLLWQLHMSDIPALQREIAELIIGNLDTEGFLHASVEELMLMGADPEEMSDYLTRTVSDVASVVAAAEGQAQAVEETSAVAAPDGTSEGEDMAARAERAPGDADPGVEANSDGLTLPPTVDPPGYPRAEVEQALELVRGFEPPGVACTSLRDSLLRQLDVRGEPEDSLARRLIAEKWDLVKKRKFEAIAKDFGVPLQALRPAVETVRTLEIRPGREFNTERTQYVEPDVHVVKVGEKYVVQLNDDGLPRLRVSRAYRRLLNDMRREGRQNDAQQYIKEKMRSAMWLIKSLDQRQRTIYKVTTSIVRQQRGFLDHGVDHLRPMVLRDVAEDIGMHESTVSRVVSNKYVHTPRGLYPLKFFFHSGIDREYGGDISSLSVKKKIQQLVTDEDERKPLSDSELMRILKREGIQIARRTVAKYRDELSIPSSTDRKKIF